MTDQVDPFSSAPPVVGTEDLLLSIKNEAGEPKYKTVEDALKALAHSQAFIPTLLSEKQRQEQELEQLREQVKKASSIDEVLKKLTANDEPPKDTTPPAGGLSADAVAELVRKELVSLEQNNQAKKNAALVQDTLTKKFGEKTKEVVAAKAAQLRTTPEKLGALATENPDLVLELFGAVKNVVTPTTSSVSIPNAPKPTTVAPPAKSVLSGATSREQKEHFLLHKAAIYQKYGIEA